MDRRTWEHGRAPHESHGDGNARENLTEWFRHRPNENKISDAYRGRALVGGGMI
jgi:hypothetical protein